MPPSANIRRRFLSWDRPLLPQAVALLAQDWTGEGPLDLSDRLVIVPTRQSGRRLREALAGFAAEQGAAVFPPQVMLPEALIAPAAAEEVATKLDSLLAWAHVFQSVTLEDFRAVFPVDPPTRAFGWALRLAQEFVRLQRALAESGLRLSDVARRAGADFAEVERWEQIGTLERLHDEALADVKLRDASAARIAQARREVEAAATADASWLAAHERLRGVRRLVMLACPDPQPLALEALTAIAQAVPVEIVVFAPETEAAAFDAWGRPQPETWGARLISLPDFAQQVHVCANPAAQAVQIAELARRYGAAEGILAVGVADPEVLPLLESEFAQTSQPAFNPEGQPRRGDGLFQLLQALATLAREETFVAVETLARCPDFLEFLRARMGAGFSAARFLRALDALHTRHLPPTLAEALRQAEREAERQARQAQEREATEDSAATEAPSAPIEAQAKPARRDSTPFAELVPVLRLVRGLRTELNEQGFPAGVTAVLAAIFGARRFDLERPEDAATAEAAEAWSIVLQVVTASAARFDELAPGDWWDVALGLYGESVRYEDKPAGAVELQGWLELLWEDAPHLVVAGFNDGRVPEAIVGDPFLPESLRERLGLKTNAARFARDAYLLHALAAWRSGAGVPGGKSDTSSSAGERAEKEPPPAARLDLLLGKTSAAGDPLRPSRLLLRCADAELPDRIARLFRPAEAARATPPWRRAWRLVPPHVSPPERVAVTGLRAWLDCPFRFFLGRVVRMEAVDANKTELDVFDFGTLCHAALEALGREAAMRDVTDAAVLREFLLDRLALEANRRFGAVLTLPLVVQLESARQRLSRAAEVQAETRAAGWIIEQVERPFEIEVAGLLVTGKIDRIDRHEQSGAVRVLDYKTSDRPVNPEQAHLRNARREETAAAFARFLGNGKEQVWTDLQLPLYLRAVAGAVALSGRVGDSAVPAMLECGYFNLPKAAGETGIQPWADYTRELDAAAWRCAEGVAGAIRAGAFWPPNETIRPEYDDFAPLFHHGVADSVEWPEPASAPEPDRSAGEPSGGAAKEEAP